MLKAVMSALMLTGIAVSHSIAGEGCPPPDQVGNPSGLTNQQIAARILCLAEGLADGSNVSQAEAGQAIEGIVQLAGKIIDNGSTAQAGQKTAQTGLQIIASAPISEPTPQPGPEVANAQAIICEADGLAQRFAPDKPPPGRLWTCEGATGSPEAIKQYASKIIGNG